MQYHSVAQTLVCAAPGLVPALFSPLEVISRCDTIVLVDKHGRTLAAVLAKRAGIAWTDIEAMLKNPGAEVSEGRGSRVRVALHGVRAVFHRSHPRNETDRGAVAALRRFLQEAGVTPEEEADDL